MSKIGKCDCKAWEDHAETIVDQAVFCHMHSAGPRHNGPQWQFCPWCGKAIHLAVGGEKLKVQLNDAQEKSEREQCKLNVGD